MRRGRKKWGDGVKITFDRLKHSHAVAIKMKEMALQNPNIYPVEPDDAFVLGLLHDIGYEFANEQREHAHRGGLVLREQNYKYWEEVYYHGISQNKFDTSMLRLLNYADMITGPTGIYVNIQERISDIADRYGKNSWQEIEAIELSKKML